MSISHKQHRLHAKNAEGSISNKDSSLEKPQSSLQEQVKTDTSLSRSSIAKNVDTSTKHSSQKKSKNWTNLYYGLQDEIYGDPS